MAKILIVEDNDLHADISGFKDAQVKRVRTLKEAVDELYGVSENGYHNLQDKNPKGYDMLLTDMNFPIGEGRFGGNDLHGLIRNYSNEIDTPTPLGWPLVNIAARMNIPYIGMITDTNHHQGAMAATFDFIEHTPMVMNGSKVCVWDSRTIVWNDREPQYRATIYDDAAGQKVKRYQDLAEYLTSK